MKTPMLCRLSHSNIGAASKRLKDSFASTENE